MNAQTLADWTPRISLSQRLTRLAGIIGALAFTAMLILALFPSTIAPFDSKERIAIPLQRPNNENILGTNDLGQDLFSELIVGTRVSLFTGLIVSFIAVFTGTVIGLASGYLSGWVDSLLMRLTDLILVLPFLPLVILLTVYLGPSQKNVVMVLSIYFWAVPARLIRARVLSLRSNTYIEAARALGATPLHIMVRHL